MINNLQGTYISCEFFEKSKTGKTNIYYVFSENGARLGIIKWYGAWRTYAFYPDADTLFETKCLKDVQVFIHAVNTERKNSKKS